jgi:predicted MFS family arabinose efflux permease
LSTTPTTLTSAAEKRAASLIYTASFSFVIALGSMQVLVPLYGLHLGYDIKALGLILSAQAVLPIFTRFFAGAIADMFGDKYVLWFSFSTMIGAAVVFALSGVFWALIAAQTLQGMARSTYWTVTQSYASRINPELAATRLGRLGSSGNAGSILGTALSGFLAFEVGYGTAFAVVAGFAFLGLLGSLALPSLPRTSSKRSFKAALAPIPNVASSRSMGMAGISAFVGSSSSMLGIILIIPFLEQASFNESEIGITRTLTAVGSMMTGLFFGKLISRLGLMRLHAAAFALQGVTFLAVPVMATQLASGLPIMFVYGLFAGILGTLYSTTAAAFSRPEQRGTAMAYAGQFWGGAQLVVPTSFGFIAAAAGLDTSLYLSGAIFIVLGFAIPVIYPLMTKHGVK